MVVCYYLLILEILKAKLIVNVFVVILLKIL